MTTRKPKRGDSPPLTIHDVDTILDAGTVPHQAAAPDPKPAAFAIGLTFVRASRVGQGFLETVTIDVADLPYVRCGVNRFGPNGLNLIMLKGRMFSYKGDFPGDGNPAHDPFIGFPLYADV